jgi:hypothetical protein
MKFNCMPPAKPAYPLTIAIIGTASRRMIVAMAKTMKYAG